MKYDEMMKQAMEMLENDDDLFVEMVNEIDSWNGYADGFRGYPMYEIDELFHGVSVSEFLDKLGRDFDHNDEYFIDTIYGIESTDDLAGHYRDNVDTGDLLDEIISNQNHIYFSDSDFEELIDNIVNYSDDEDDDEPQPIIMRTDVENKFTGEPEPEHSAEAQDTVGLRYGESERK